MIQSVTVKFPGMRSEKRFVIYPAHANENFWIIQTDNRIAKVMVNGQVTLSKNTGKTNPAFVYLNQALGAKLCEAPDGLVDELKRKMPILATSDGTVTLAGAS